MKLKIEQVGKGGLPPLTPTLLIGESGGKPPFPTCSIQLSFFRLRCWSGQFQKGAGCFTEHCLLMTVAPYQLKLSA
jgi:hypothetical protein